MGGSNSKEGTLAKHVFASDTPVQFSAELIDALQASAETNSTRAKTLELHISQRVAAELEKIQKHESDKLDSLRNKLSSSSDSDSSSSSKKDSSDSSSSSSSSLPSISASDLVPSALQSDKSKEENSRKSQTSAKVQAEIEKLKKALGERKTLKEMPGEVDKARERVISCLRINDRKPLDCWKEVETFKREVRRLEEKMVGDLL